MFKLKKLYSNQNSFHTIVFKEGLNVVIGQSEKQTNPKNEQKKKTLNGVGKSLIIRLIDFCLGADSIKDWMGPLQDWIFYLDFTIDDETVHKIERSVNNQLEIILDSEPMKLTKFRQELKEMLNISDDFTYRECINRFLRKGKKAFNNYLTTIPGEKDCKTLEILIYLLNLDYKRCQTKIKLKSSLDENISLLRKAEKDNDFRGLFGGGESDIDIELANIDFDINKLKKDLESYKFAENFNDIKKKADLASDQLDNLNNKRFVIESNIKNIIQSLEQEISTTIESVKEVYEEVKLQWSEKLSKELEDVNAFHFKLLDQRKVALNRDLIYQQKQLQEINKLIENINSELNRYLSFLDTHKAMDKYVVIVKQIDQLNEKKNNIQQIRLFEKKIKQRIEEIKQKMSNENIDTELYVENNKLKIDKLNSEFMVLAKTFYINKKSGLIIKNNNGINQQRFDIQARITSDGSDGIQEIITFCFDWIILNMNRIKQGFIYHDSLLIANVEKRQKEILFELAEKLCQENKKQYIININYDQINGFDSNVIKLIEDNTILTLSDKDEKEKLLGVEIDLGSDMN